MATGCDSRLRQGASGSAAARTPGAVTTLPAAAPTTTTTAKPEEFTVATASVPSVEVFDAPGSGGRRVRALPNPRPSAELGKRVPLVMLVREEQGEWLKVLIPVRPNGSSGWIRRSDVTLDRHDYRIEVSLGAHRLTAWKGNDVILHEPVGVGRAATGTPGGLFYTTELIKVVGQPVYGPYAFALSGFSEVHLRFAGGEGTLGIHGTNNPGALGTDVSNGCIRMSNAAITRLANTLPVGVPVQIRA